MISTETKKRMNDDLHQGEMEEPLETATGEKARELRARLGAAIESAKVTAQKLEEKTIAAAKATDRCIRDHPYQTLGVAFGLGLLLGVLLGRRKD